MVNRLEPRPRRLRFLYRFRGGRAWYRFRLLIRDPNFHPVTGYEDGIRVLDLYLRPPSQPLVLEPGPIAAEVAHLDPPIGVRYCEVLAGYQRTFQLHRTART